MKKLFSHLLWIIVFCFPVPVFSQDATVVDTLKKKLGEVHTTADRFYILESLSRVMMNVNLQEAEKYGSELIRMAEESRDRKLMVRAYLSNGLRCSYFRGQKSFITRSIDYYEKALEIARKNKLEEEIGGAQLRLAIIYLALPDRDKALSYANQAFSLISTLDNDSLRSEGHTVYGQVYQARNDKTLALRNYLTGLRIAEEMKAEKKEEINRKSILLRNAYLFLSDFYKSIGDYDKALDYITHANHMLDKITDKSVPFQRVIDISSIGNLYASKKSYDMAIYYYERSIRMADSLKFSSLKIPAYLSLLNQYLQLDQPQKAHAYMQSPAGMTLKQYLSNVGLSSVIDQAYAVIYTEMGRFDSAGFYFNRAQPYFEHGSNENHKMSFYSQLAGYHKKMGNDEKAIEYLLKVKELADRLGNLEVVRNTAKNLDSLFGRKSDFKQAGLYNGIYHLYKDSIEKINKEKEISQVEAADEQQRQERIAREKEEAKKKRYRIQYFAITIGIAAFFVLLVMMGMFRVSVNTIKAIGFFVFIMLFEFIFLIFKKNIAGITQNEPWKDLVFMIALAMLLLPLHHWLEHRVIKYLTSHNRLTIAGHRIRARWFGGKRY